MDRIIPTLAAATAALSISASVMAQEFDLGQQEFMNSCAQCHGADGTGNGVMAGYLVGSLPDLSRLQAENGGVFPVQILYDTIDSGGAVGAHGSSEMPAWGDRYRAKSPEMLGEFWSHTDADRFVRGRVLALIEYISTLQTE
jgi:mono/diheme cytochrome c family protein